MAECDVVVTTALPDGIRREVRRLVRESGSRQIPVLSDEALLQFDASGSTVSHLYLACDGSVRAYGVLWPDGDTDTRHLEIVYSASAAAFAEVSQVLAAVTGLVDSFDVWSHGDSLVEDAAAGAGCSVARQLFKMDLALGKPLTEPDLPSGISIRTYEPADLPAVVDINRRAFANLPDQRSWTKRDFRVRMAQPWFDPAGFFVAIDGDEIVGFHWTKISDEGTPAQPPLGEIYVLAVIPEAGGRGIGRLLAGRGLAHCEARGVAVASLFVDSDNTAAVKLYESVGFEVVATDTLLTYSRGVG